MRKSYFDFRFIVGLLAVAFVVLLAGQVALADNVYANLHGTATDVTGAIVAGADVTATNTQTGVKTTVKSRDNGYYEFPQLLVGSYTVSASKQGFKSFKSTEFNLDVNQSYDMPIHFEVGSVNETVEVKAEAVQVETTSMQQQT